MRAGPLSNPKIISLLNSYYIPVYVSNEDYEGKGVASPDERAEYRRIFLEFIEGKLGTGSVHVYILKPDGHALNGMDIGTAMKIDREIAVLEQDARQLHTVPGDPVVKPGLRSTRPLAAPDALVLHLVARRTDTGPQGGSWNEFPSENWLVFDRAQWATFLPPGKPHVGTSWEIDRAVAAKLLVYFYPQTEQTGDNNIQRNRIDRQSMTATLVSMSQGLVRIRLDGSLRMKHTFYPGKEDNNFIDATFVGYADIETDKPRLRAFHLATDTATYVGKPFHVGVAAAP